MTMVSSSWHHNLFELEDGNSADTKPTLAEVGSTSVPQRDYDWQARSSGRSGQEYSGSQSNALLTPPGQGT